MKTTKLAYVTFQLQKYFHPIWVYMQVFPMHPQLEMRALIKLTVSYSLLCSALKTYR